jgi:pyruvate dehydrogenase E1 component alpha subunit
MVLELYGRGEGICGGKGGSMHIADLDLGSLGANGIVGAGAPLSTGAALTLKTKGSDGVAVCFQGDGSTNEGYVFEAMNLAVVLQLPVIFYVENNGFGEFTGVDYAVGAPSIADRASSFGMPTKQFDGTDFFAVYSEMADVIEYCRSGRGPYFVESQAVRFYGHFEGDPQRYRTDEEMEDSRENRDCIKLFRQRVVSEGLVTEEELNAVDEDLMETYKSYVQEAKLAPWPAHETLEENVYVSY